MASRVRAHLRRLVAHLVVPAALLGFASAAFALDVASLYPHAPGNQWSYANGIGGTLTITFGSQVTLPDGTVVIPLTRVDNETCTASCVNYYTFDTNGWLEYQAYIGSVYVSGYGNTSENATFSPPMSLAPATVNLNTTYTSSGSVALSLTNVASATLNYSESTEIDGYQTVTSNDGTQSWSALEVVDSFTLSGTISGQFFTQTSASTLWVAPNVGPVQVQFPNASGALETWKLVSTNVTPPPSYTLSVTVAGFGTVTSSPAGITCNGGTCTGSFTQGTVVTLYATPLAPATFSGWAGACGGTGSCVVTMNSAQSVTANFSNPSTNDLLTLNMLGSGSVTSNPAGINCTTGTCTANFQQGTAITLTATPASGATFNGWGGGICSGTGACSFTLTAPQTIQANFSTLTGVNTLSVAIAGSANGTGSVTSSPSGIDCFPGSAMCSASFPNGTVVTLTASPAPCCVLYGWSGACTGTGVCAVTMSAPQAVTANFGSTSPEAGFWWNPSEGGTGFVIEVQNTNLYMAGFLYAASGEATWFASSGPLTSPGVVDGYQIYIYQGAFTTYSGGQTLNGSYQPATQNPNSPGDVTITFANPSHATITWPGGGTTIERFDFGAGGSETAQPPINPQTGWWWNASEGGRGFAVEIQGTTMYFAGYMYDTSGNPIWYLATGTMTNAGLFQGELTQYGNGQTLTGAYQAASVVDANVGAITLQFTTPTNGTLTLPDGRQIPLARFTF